MIVLWLLMFRALGIELRHQLNHPLWTQFWDVAFAVASFLLVLFLGAAQGNVVRGVPLDSEGIFFEPLWTDFRVGQQTGILDWYTILAGLTAVLALAHHGALWLCARTDGAVEERAGRVAGHLWPLVCIASIVLVLSSFFVQPLLKQSLVARPWGVLFPAVAAAGLIGLHGLRRRARPTQAFLASAIYLYGTMATVANGIYPYVLPGRDPDLGLTVEETAAAHSGLVIGMVWWIPGMLLASGYFVYMYGSMPSKFSLSDTADH